MKRVEVTFSGVSANDLAARIKQDGRAAVVDAVKELNARGGGVRKGLVDVLTKQTGLKKSVLNRALKASKAEVADPVYEILATGGDISLMHFGARETQAGVSAAPWGQREIFAGTFMKAGWWPNRVVKPGWHGQVFRRAGGKTEGSEGRMDKFIKVKSGLFIAEELVTGAAKDYFEQAAQALGTAVARVVAGRLP